MSVSLEDVETAAERISDLVHETPVLTSDQLNSATGIDLFFKSEHLQKVGAFKARGAVNAVYSLDESVLKQGVATHSSGNHGAALARAAQLRGAPAYIVVPANAKQVKKDAIAGYGAEIIECEPTLEAREATLAQIVEETGANFVHPYDDDCIIAGQGTAALELTRQVPDLDVIITPIGGGGLLAGSALVAEANNIKIYGAEPKGADDAARSFRSGQLVTSHLPDTICDGLLTTVGVRNWQVIQPRIEDVLVVRDEETAAAMYLIWTRLKQIVEPSSAICLAAVMQHVDQFRDLRVGLVLTGGNVDLSALPFEVSDQT